ncbi:MAG: FAD-dependent oxidoreductase [Chloroflexota bacterium]
MERTTLSRAAPSVKLSQNADVIVVGCGLSGAMAAMEAADCGASVIVLEKMDEPGGCARWSTAQLSGACTKLQLMAGIKDAPVLHFTECMAIGEYKNNSRLLKLAVEQAGPTIDWLCDIGVPLELSKQTGHEAYSVQRTCGVPVDKAEGSGGLNVFRAVFAEMMKRVERGDIRYQAGVRASRLVLDSNGVVTGIEAERKDGTHLRFSSKNVVLTTGGFSGNVQLMRQHNPHLKNMLVFPALADFATGDGILMAQAISAQISSKGYAAGYPGGVEDRERPGLCRYIVDMKQYPGAIWVDGTGRRIANENTESDTVREEAALKAVDCIIYVILDRVIKEQNRPIVLGNFSPEGLDWPAFEREAEKGVFVFRAETIGSLAEKCGIDVGSLEQTISRYNSYVSSGRDPEFGRRELQYAISNPPFYAIRTRPRVLSGMPGDGISVNEHRQALDTNGRVISGLYAAGDAIGTAAVSGRRPCAGFALTPALIFGRIAGQNAARQALREWC